MQKDTLLQKDRIVHTYKGYFGSLVCVHITCQVIACVFDLSEMSEHASRARMFTIITVNVQILEKQLLSAVPGMKKLVLNKTANHKSKQAKDKN